MKNAPIKDRILYRLAQGSETVPPCGFDRAKCWPWPGSCNEAGYPVIASDPEGERYVHRIMHREFIGPVPAGHDVEHKCHTDDPTCVSNDATCPHRPCTNPWHTEAVTRSENQRRRRPPGRMGETCSHESPVKGCRLCYNRQQREWRRARELRKGQPKAIS